MRSTRPDGGLTTVLFVDVDQSAGLLGPDGDAARTEAVGRQLAPLRERVEAYGGREASSTVGSMMLMFDSPRQAVSFALATQRALAASAPRVRMGIATGEMADASNDPTGVAVSLIAGRASGGEILVSDVVRQLVDGAPSISFVDRGRHGLAGFRERWQLWQATDASVRRAHFGTIGRVAERAAMQRLVDGLAARVGGALAVAGEAGIGKTHLVREIAVRANLAGVQVLEVGADEVTRRPGFVPYGMIDDDRVPAAQRAVLRELLQRPRGLGDPGDFSFAIVEASVDAFESLARSGPTLLIVEDAHWADDLSLAVVRSLVRRSPSAGFGVVISLRLAPRSAMLDRLVESLVDSGGPHLQLEALDDLDLQALCAVITGAAPGPQLRTRLQATGGNPLFVSELLRSYDEEGLVRIESGIAEVPPSVTPSSLNETLVRRLSWLPVETRELLRLASLLGTSFTLTDVATVTGRSVIDVAAWLREASVAGLITGESDRLVFRHDLLRDAVYDDMLPAERRDLHRAAAQALVRANAPTQQIARQFARGATSGDLEAVRWLVRAADETIAIAPSTAVALFDEALALAPARWDGRPNVQARMIEPIAWCGQYTRAEQISTAVLDADPTSEVEFAALRGLAAVYGNRGDIPAAVATIQRSVEVAQAPVAESLRLQCVAAQLRVLTGDLSPDDGEPVAHKTLDIGVESGDATTQCVAHQVLGCIKLLTGHIADAQPHFRQAIALYDSGKATPTSYLIPDHFFAIGLIELGDLDGAIEAASAARSRYEQRGALSQLPMAYSITGLAHYYAGRLDEATTELEAGAAVVEDTGNLNFVLYSESILTRIAVRRGDLDGAAAKLAIGLEALSAGSSFGADWLLDNQTQYLVAIGDLDAAMGIAEFTWSQTESIRYFYGYRERGIVATRLAMDCGRLSFANTVADSIEEGNHRSPSLCGQAFAQQARGLVDSDASQLVDAVAIFRETPFRMALADCCEDAASALATTNQRNEAIDMLTEALSIRSAAGALLDGERAEAALRELGAAKTPPAKRPTFGWDSLTPRELAVSALVAEGLTNPEIGARLHVSRRTIETHIAHVFRKLDFVSRTQIASEFTRRKPT